MIRKLYEIRRPKVQELDDVYTIMQLPAPFNKMYDGEENGMIQNYRKHWNLLQKAVNKIGAKHIWSIIEGDDGNLYATPGFQTVNWFGYVFTVEPWKNELEEYLW